MDKYRIIPLVEEAQKLVKTKLMAPTWDYYGISEEGRHDIARVEFLLETILYELDRKPYLNKEGFPYDEQ